MSSYTEVSAVAISAPKPIRHTANFHPNIWGDQFLKETSEYKPIDPNIQKEHEQLKQEVRWMIMDTTVSHAQKLHLIDAVQRLGVAYLFVEEIEDSLDNISSDSNSDDYNDLCTVSIYFRLLRQHGIRIPVVNVFEKFKDCEGKSKSSLNDDIQGLLNLYEAAYLGIHGEDLLDEAIAFTTVHLNSAVSCALHRKDLHDILQWKEKLDLATKFPYARVRRVEEYFWILGILFEPQYSYGIKKFTQILSLLVIIDDTFDSYGTLEEFTLFTEAIKRWEIDAIDSLPDYMKHIYKAVLGEYAEIEEHMTNQGKPCYISYAKERFEQERGHVASAIECYMKQHGVSEEEAVKMMKVHVEKAWKDMNEDMLKPTSVSMNKLERVLSYACAIHVIYYKSGDSFNNPHKLKDKVALLLRDPVPL
ncbi:hypothetical protein Patl1_20694 [Pistacia atlantica]|uniref:Uncharacterized protein n=1 Tax=Pistacia atlantica TaxID=434234 RepID=A0ACC1BLL4_9ROSI|nr:hypothetical protein Patl1_20694 [Pistacia atlantica]